MRRTTRFRQLITSGEMLLLPCAHDGVSARIAAQEGFSAVCAGGYGASATLLGAPDIWLLTMTEMAAHVGRIADATDLPVFADADTGHGGLPNVARTVRAFERAGAAGLFIEDQVNPKRCGHMDGKEVVSRDEMLARLRAALDARQDPDFVIMGRTDALAVLGLDEAIARGRLLREAGADMIFVEAPESPEQMRRITAGIPGPHFGVYLEGGRIPLLPAREFAALGYQVLAFGASGLYAAAHAVRETFREIKTTGETRQAQKRMISFAGFNDLLGLADIRGRERGWAEKAGRKP